MKLVREAISFQRYKDPKEALGLSPYGQLLIDTDNHVYILVKPHDRILGIYHDNHRKLKENECNVLWFCDIKPSGIIDIFSPRSISSVVYTEKRKDLIPLNMEELQKVKQVFDMDQERDEIIKEVEKNWKVKIQI